MTRLAIALSLCFAATAAPGDVVLRGGLSTVTDPIARIDIEGIHFAGQTPYTLGWHAVLRVTGEGADEAELYAELSENAWRARYRLARGDTTLAHPLFDDLYLRLASSDGPTAELAAEGALRTRLQYQLQADAVGPWLDLIRLKVDRDGELRRFTSSIDGQAAIEAKTALSPSLPPAFLSGTALPAQPPRDGLPQALADWYAVAAEWTFGVGVDPSAIEHASRPPTGSQEDLRRHPGVALLRTLIRAWSSDANERASARSELEPLARSSTDGWRRGWALFALGRSLSLESDELSRTRAAILLIQTAAEFAPSLPALANIASAEAGAVLAGLGRSEYAQRLLFDLRSTAPSSTATQWLEERLQQPTGNASGDPTP